MVEWLTDETAGCLIQLSIFGKVSTTETFNSSVTCHTGYIYFVTGQKDSESLGDFEDF